MEDLDIAIQRTLNTIEKTGSAAAEERLKNRETEELHMKFELDRLRLQLSTAKMEISPEAMSIILDTWRAQFDRLRESGNVRESKAGCCNSSPELTWDTTEPDFSTPTL